jgi:hypothetical protein
MKENSYFSMIYLKLIKTEPILVNLAEFYGPSLPSYKDSNSVLHLLPENVNFRK